MACSHDYCSCPYTRQNEELFDFCQICDHLFEEHEN